MASTKDTGQINMPVNNLAGEEALADTYIGRHLVLRDTPRDMVWMFREGRC